MERYQKRVAVAMNFDNIECTSKVQRWSSEKRERVTIPQPNLINTYNKHMGGVDIMTGCLKSTALQLEVKNGIGVCSRELLIWH